MFTNWKKQPSNSGDKQRPSPFITKLSLVRKKPPLPSPLSSHVDSSTSMAGSSQKTDEEHSTTVASLPLLSPIQPSSLVVSPVLNAGRLLRKRKRSLSPNASLQKENTIPAPHGVSKNSMSALPQSKNDKSVATKTEFKPMYMKPQIFTIVTGLRGFVVEHNYNGVFEVILDEVMEVINDDVFFISMAMAEFSLYVHFTFAKKYRQFGYPNLPMEGPGERVKWTTKWRNLLKTVVGRNDDMDEEYRNLRNSLPLHHRPKYDTYRRTVILDEAIKTFEINMRNSIVLRLPKLLARFFLKVPAENGERMDRNAAVNYIRVLLSPPYPYDERLRVSFSDLNEDPYQYINFMYYLQEALRAAGTKSFHVIPRGSYQQKFIHYTHSAIEDFVARYCMKTNQQYPGKINGPVNTRLYHSLFFGFDKYETENKKYKSILTDGVRVHIIMERQEKEMATLVSDKIETQFPHKIHLHDYHKYPLPNYDYVGGVDPGIKLMIGGVVYNSVTGKRKLFKLSSRSYLDSVGHYSRKVNFLAWSRVVESRIAKDREALDNIGASSQDYQAFVAFELKNFMLKINLYAQVKFRRLTFDNYIRRRKKLDAFVDDFCPRDGTTLLFYGSARFPSFIKGYIRTPQSGLMSAFRRLKRCTILPTGEFRSTKCCSMCFNVLQLPASIKNRSRSCDVCKISFNRDTNAGANMIVRGLAEHFGDLGFNLPQGLKRQPRNVVRVVQNLDEQFNESEDEDYDFLFDGISDTEDDDDSDDDGDGFNDQDMEFDDEIIDDIPVFDNDINDMDID